MRSSTKKLTTDIGGGSLRKAIFEEWLIDPNATMYQVSANHGKYTWSIQVHSTQLKKLGIIRLRRMEAS